MQRRFKVTAVVMSAVLTLAMSAPVRAEEEPPPTTTTEPTITVIDTVVPETPPTSIEGGSETPGSDTEVSEEPSTEAPASAPPTSDETPGQGTDAPAVAVTQDEPDGNSHVGDQVTEVSGTQVVISNSGGNEITDDGTGPTVGGNGGSVGTGSADAIGSRDVNNVEQTADIVLTDNAVANLLQLALIINVGAALANSGLNGVTSTPDGIGQSGVIGTGNATAVGNDIDQYALQAANGSAGAGETDDDTQLALSLWMGLALSNSGINAINGTGVAGSGGDIGSGSATAIGNDSLTDIGQHAVANGSGDSVIDIAQRAAVLNLGFALANSGINDISGAAGALLAANDADDDAIAEQLFVMLLPALLQANGYGVGSGSIASGDASATGNSSQTFIQQIAAATASGDGIASIAQDIIIANVGAAGANTGGNSLGKSLADLTPEQATAVVSLAAFLSAMLAQVHGVMSGKALEMQDAGLDIPFGDLVLQVNGRLTGSDSQVTQGGTTANIHQITIIISLGIAKSNTGINNVQSIDSQDNVARAVEFNTPEAALAVANQIHSGNTDARNTNLVIICQRIDADNVACLAPPPVVDPPGDDPDDPEVVVPPIDDPADPGGGVDHESGVAVIPKSPAIQQSSGSLPTTGIDMEGMVQGGLTLFAFGVLLLTFRRRRPVKWTAKEAVQ